MIIAKQASQYSSENPYEEGIATGSNPKLRECRRRKETHDSAASHRAIKVRISAEMRIQVDQPERFEFHRETLSNKTQERYGQKPHAYWCAYESHKDEILAEGQDCQLYEAGRRGEVIKAVPRQPSKGVGLGRCLVS
jgi:hypothetical protein